MAIHLFNKSDFRTSLYYDHDYCMQKIYIRFIFSDLTKNEKKIQRDSTATWSMICLTTQWGLLQSLWVHSLETLSYWKVPLQVRQVMVTRDKRRQLQNKWDEG